MPKSKPRPPVEAGNALSLAEYISSFLPRLSAPSGLSLSLSPSPLSVTAQSAATLAAADLDACFRLLESSSAADYAAAGQGWKPRAKRREMKLPDMRYLLVRRPTEGETGSGGGAEGAAEQSSGPVEGFASFMLTYEDGHEVAYLYEIHVGAELQGRGVGRELMGLVEEAGRRAGMAKAMLTVFAGNKGARAFYDRLGYAVDEFSPEPRTLRGGVVKEPDYFILSKAV